MEIIFNDNDIINLFSNTKNYVGEGSYGLVRKYDDSKLIKTYKEFVGTARIKDYPDRLKEAKVQEEYLVSRYKDLKRKSERLKLVKTRLECTKYANDLLLGTALYDDFTFGAVLKYYEGYKKFKAENINLSDSELLELILNIDLRLQDLYNNRVYPFDVKESNVLFNDNLDVKIIDLDDFTTIYSDSIDYNAEKVSTRNFDDMIYRVRRGRIK